MTNKKSVLEIVKNAYIEIGKESNLNRVIPYILDGLKPVYKKVILSAIDFNGKISKTAQIIGATIGDYHPHGDAALKPVIAELVRSGFFVPEGDFGFYSIIEGMDSEGAAPRYTSTAIKKELLSIIKEMLPYTPTSPNYTNRKEEANYIPFPIPFSLMMSTYGIGIGITTDIPGFTAQSLLSAYLNDNYKLLKSSFGYEYPNKKELKALWENGIGKVTVKFKVYPSKTSDCGFIISGNPKEFKPKIKKLEELENEGKITIRDISDGDGQKLLIERIPNIKSLPKDQLEQMVNDAATNEISYKIVVQDNIHVFPIGIKKWINTTYNNCLSLLETRRKDIISKKEFEMKVFSLFRKVADMIINNEKMSYQEIAQKVNTDLNVVEAISRYSIGTLRTMNPIERVEKIKNEIKEYKNMNLKEHIKKIIDNI